MPPAGLAVWPSKGKKAKLASPPLFLSLKSTGSVTSCPELHAQRTPPLESYSGVQMKACCLLGFHVNMLLASVCGLVLF